LWQSTLFAVVAGLLTLLLRKNHARARHWLWLAASVKFLIPFSVLVSLGSRLAWPSTAAASYGGFYFMVEQVSQPFAPATISVSSRAPATFSPGLIHLLPFVLVATWFCGFLTVLLVWRLRWRRITAIIRNALPLDRGREVEALRRLERRGGMRKPLAMRLSRASLEPGIFGIARPVLIWPEGVSERLEDGQLEAILAHELWHARRRDNLAAALHMVVEAVFWFHPLVWWLGARLVEERERACDEAVVQLGHPPRVYAESILNVCKFCVGSPLPCVSGVTGADLKTRIVRIMTDRVASKLDLSRKLLLSAVALMAIGAPVVFGLLHAAPGQAQSQSDSSATSGYVYEVASIKPNKSADNMTRLMYTPDSLSASGVTLQMLMMSAYDIQDNQLSGAPGWLQSDKYDIEAKMDSAVADRIHKIEDPEQRLAIRQHMLQALLADRCKLAIHRESTEQPVYALVIAKGGSKLHEAKPGDTYPNGLKGPNGQPGAGMMMMRGNGGPMTGQGIPLSNLVRFLSRQLGRKVIDKTGLTGNYDFTLKWAPDQNTPMFGGPGGGPAPADPAPPDSSGPSLFTAVQEQLGLKLESQKGQVDLIVIDHVEKPSQN
jgi:uncharacterized protein (TIGR03435 family)